MLNKKVFTEQDYPNHKTSIITSTITILVTTPGSKEKNYKMTISALCISSTTPGMTAPAEEFKDTSLWRNQPEPQEPGQPPARRTGTHMPLKGRVISNTSNVNASEAATRSQQWALENSTIRKPSPAPAHPESKMSSIPSTFLDF